MKNDNINNTDLPVQQQLVYI